MKLMVKSTNEHWISKEEAEAYLQVYTALLSDHRLALIDERTRPSMTLALKGNILVRPR